ncbi:glutathione S-transferase [Mycena polygramma]|nr:glutathione S-transferase [Mycena polygramma]
MAILKLYSGPAKLPTCARRVAMVLHELKIPFEVIEIDLLAGEQKTPAVLEHSPFGQIPYIDNDGFILYETRAICRYLVAKHPESGLIPTDPKAHALFEQAAAVEVATFEPAAGKVWRELSKKIIFGKTPDQAALEEALEALDKKLDVYDGILSKQRYLGGDARSRGQRRTITLADLFHALLAYLVGAGGSDIMIRKPNVARWFNELMARPSWLAYLDGVETTLSY